MVRLDQQLELYNNFILKYKETRKEYVEVKKRETILNHKH